MSIVSWLKRLLARKRPRTFTLGKRGKPGIPGAREDVVAGRHEERPPYGTRRSEEMGQEAWEATTGPSEQNSWVLPENRQYLTHSTLGGMSREKRDLLSREIGRSLDETARTLMAIFHAPRNISLVHRLFEIKSGSAKVRCALFYVEGVVDGTSIRTSLLKPLLDLNTGNKSFQVSAEGLAGATIPESQVRFATTYAHLVHGLLTGQAVVVIDGEAKAIMADQRSMEHRAVDESPTEAVVRGPHSGFVENMYANLTLVRSQINSPDLVFERVYIGARGQTPLTIAYIEGIVNPKLVEEARRRLGAISTDIAAPNALQARFIEDDPLSPVPGVLLTERPDRVASMLAEGHVALVDNAPSATVFPMTIWDLMHSPEDYYVNPFVATFVRGVRWLALLAVLYSSAIYVSLVTFHPEMIPTELLFSIAASRETIPFPAVVEVLLMEGAFELLREAGLRVPTLVGPTIGIVGAVILGQAAVQARVVSPVLVIVVALSGLSSFAIPNYDLGLAARLARFLMIAVASILGIPGLTITTIVLLVYVFSLRSFGVPITAPLVPAWPHAPDILSTGPVWMMRYRPSQVRPLDRERQPAKARASVSFARRRRTPGGKHQ